VEVGLDGALEGVVEAAVVLALVDGGAAVAAQAQTARAEEEAARPVTAPQAPTTQAKASLLMAAKLALLHWQSKSVEPHPTTEAAELMQEVAQAGT